MISPWMVAVAFYLAGLTGVALGSSTPVSNDWDDQDTYGQFGSHGL
jgi:hypothetical protein